MAAPEPGSTVKIFEYRAKSIEAFERAAHATDPVAAAGLKLVAESYRDMAERLERLNLKQ